jgi:ribosomal protein S18 acetylase RimI-like enzyme
MSLESVEEDYLMKSRFWFPEGIAPFGEMNIVRSDHLAEDWRRSSVSSTIAEHMAPYILRKAWSESQWLIEAVGEDKAKDLANAKSESKDYEIDFVIQTSIDHANLNPIKRAAWFAVQPPSGEVKKYGAIKGLGPEISGDQVAGFANAKHDVSGNGIQKIIKRLRHSEKIYAAVSNVAVLPEAQNKYIGSALLYASLGMFRPDQVPTMYVASTNSSLMEKLEELDYFVTGSRPRTDLIPGAEIEEVRLVADSVINVRQRLIDQLPWLAAAESVYEYA